MESFRIMLKRDFAHAGLLAFGAGVAVGCKFSRSSRFVTGILEKLGFDLTEIALDMWDPEGPAPKKPPKAKRRKRTAATPPAPVASKSSARSRSKAKSRQTA